MALKVMLFRVHGVGYTAYLGVSEEDRGQHLGLVYRQGYPMPDVGWIFCPVLGSRVYKNQWKAPSLADVRERLTNRIRKLKDAGQLEYAIKGRT